MGPPPADPHRVALFGAKLGSKWATRWGSAGGGTMRGRIGSATGLLVRPVVGWGNVQRGDDEA